MTTQTESRPLENSWDEQSLRQERLTLRLPGLVSDYRTLCAAHVAPVREVLHGQRYRYKLTLGTAMMHFYHGCLMTTVVEKGVMRSLPPFGLNADGTPYLQAVPSPQEARLAELADLSKSTRLYLFSLLKEVFKGYALRYRWEDPASGQVAWQAVPKPLRGMLAEVDWRTA